MKIALFGYGKMGKTIERLALDRGHTIVAKIDKELHEGNLADADVAIDFSVPTEAFNNIVKSFNENIPIVSGTKIFGFNEDQFGGLRQIDDNLSEVFPFVTERLVALLHPPQHAVYDHHTPIRHERNDSGGADYLVELDRTTLKYGCVGITDLWRASGRADFFQCARPGKFFFAVQNRNHVPSSNANRQPIASTLPDLSLHFLTCSDCWRYARLSSPS